MFAMKRIADLIGKSRPRELDTLVKAYAQQGRFSGAVLVAQGEEMLLRKGYGYAEQSGDWNRITPSTAFRIGSMTKPFTAIATMQLAQAGQLTLDDPLHKYLPAYPRAESITIRHLLSNRSGIEDYILLPAYVALQTQPATYADLIALFRDVPLRFAPDSDYGYSNSNWVLLALILEQVTGKPFLQLIQEQILVPAGMASSGMDWATAQKRATGYVDSQTGLQPASVIDSSTMRGGGDIHATLDDFFRFAQALRTDKLLPSDVLQTMWSPLTTLDDVGYGLGFEYHTLHGQPAVGHSGGLPGFVSKLMLFPANGLTIILLSNLGSAAYEMITNGLAAIMLDMPYTLPGKHTYIAVAPEKLQPYSGSYSLEYFGRTTTLTFHLEQGRLVMQTPGLPATVLSALSQHRFLGRSKGEVELTFNTEPDGQVNRIDLIWGGYKLTAMRLSTNNPHPRIHN
jgi:CubicO group peptidase (beta-lactamase class C family)